VDSDPYPSETYHFIYLFQSSSVDYAYIIPLLPIVILFLFISALMSSSEVALFSLKASDLDQIEKDNPKAKSRIINLIDKPQYLLSTILITNNFVNIGIILISNLIIKEVLPSSIPSFLNFFITVVLVTFFLVLFGEIAPKVYASSSPTKRITLSKFVSFPLVLLKNLFYPISWLLVNSTGIVERRLSRNVKKGAHNTVSQREIEHAIELTVGDSLHAAEDIGLLKSIVKFGNISVANIMKSRLDVVAVDKNLNFKDLLQVIRSSNYSRIPVYEETFDKIIGIIHTKDLLEHFNETLDFDWITKVRSPFFVPDSKKIDMLFSEFQQKRTHMAIVVDEYGGCSGIVTLEDILEEIVGEINDEFDEPEDVSYKKLSENVFVLDGKTSVIDLCKLLELDLSYFDDIRESAETLGGMLLLVQGEIPKKGSTLFLLDYKFIIQQVSERRIETIKLIVPKNEI